MNKIKRKTIYIILLLIFLLAAVIIAITLNNRRYNMLALLSKAYSLKTTVTAAEMEKKGYIDVSNVHQKENKEITKFLQRAGRNKRAVVKTFWIQDDQMVLKIFLYDPKIGYIMTNSYRPWAQDITEGEKAYLVNYSALEQNGAITIQLTNVKHPAVPAGIETLTDAILYSYIP